MAKVRLTEDDVEYLRELANVSAGRIYLQSQRRLEKLGLITIHQGRYGEYTRMVQHDPPVVASGVDRAAVTAQVESPTRGSDPRSQRNASERKAMITASRHITKHRR